MRWLTFDTLFFISFGLIFLSFILGFIFLIGVELYFLLDLFFNGLDDFFFHDDHVAGGEEELLDFGVIAAEHVAS